MAEERTSYPEENPGLGDAWFFDYPRQRIIRARILHANLVRGINFVYLGYTAGSGAKILQGGFRMGYDCFPTREALCEHFKKIFK